MPSASRCTAPASGWTGMSTRSCVTSGRPPGRLDNVARHGDRDLAGRGRRRVGRGEAAVGMARNAWFETVAEAERRAKRQLPKSVTSALLAGCEAGVTYRDNLRAFTELGFAPHVGGLFAGRELSTTVMGQPLAMPVLLSPTGVQAVHPDGGAPAARRGARAACSGRRERGAPGGGGRRPPGRGRGGRRDGAEPVRKQADRGGRRRQ